METLAEGSAPKVVHSHDWQAGASCWQEASIPHHVDFSKRLMTCPHNTAAGFLKSKWSKEEQVRSDNVFCDLASEVTFHHFCYILLVTKINPNTRGDYPGHEYQAESWIGVTSENGHHTWSVRCSCQDFEKWKWNKDTVTVEDYLQLSTNTKWR